MKLYMHPMNLNYFEALASDTRLQIIQLLAEKDMNIKQLAEALNVSSSIMTKHIRKLESAGLITTNHVSKDGNRQKFCTLLNIATEIQVPFNINRGDSRKKFYETSLPVGHFCDLRVSPPCGIASEKQVIGNLDEPIHMLSPERMHAQLLWMEQGYVEYVLPNYLLEKQRLTEIEISGEFGSEIAGYRDDWSSCIELHLNQKKVCSFATPGDFGSKRGTLTPEWWTNNQYGILVVIRINGQGVFVNGEKKNTALTIADLNVHCDRWHLRFEVGCPSSDSGGLTIFGEKFGNYAQDILFRTFYE